MLTSLSCCASLIACSDDHLLCYVIIVVISIWLFWYMIVLLTCFASCLLDRNLLVTLYLSLYYLLYLKGLMCFVQVFQITSMYVPSSSQLLWLMIGEVFNNLYPCCFCKLLGLFSCTCRLLWFVPCLCSLDALLYLLCSLVLLAKCVAFSLSTLTLVP